MSSLVPPRPKAFSLEDPDAKEQIMKLFKYSGDLRLSVRDVCERLGLRAQNTEHLEGVTKLLSELHTVEHRLGCVYGLFFLPDAKLARHEEVPEAQRSLGRARTGRIRQDIRERLEILLQFFARKMVSGQDTVTVVEMRQEWVRHGLQEKHFSYACSILRRRRVLEPIRVGFYKILRSSL